MNFIFDPNTFESYSIFSKEGTLLLKNYVKLYQSGGAGGAGLLPTITMSVPERASPGINCPEVEIDGKIKYLGIYDYKEAQVEALGYNPPLENEKITEFINTRQEDTILTWILYQNTNIDTQKTPRLTDASEKYTLVAVHNETIYEHSAKHNTILKRMNEPDLLYIASGEFMYIPDDKTIYWNLQSGTFFSHILGEETAHTEVQDRINTYEYILKPEFTKLLQLNNRENKHIKLNGPKSETFITKLNEVSPEYLKKLYALREMGLVKINLSDTMEDCKNFINQTFLGIRLVFYKKQIDNIKRLKATKPQYAHIYDKQFRNMQELYKNTLKILEKAQAANDGGGSADGGGGGGAGGGQ
jgi:hypothetical protein